VGVKARIGRGNARIARTIVFAAIDLIAGKTIASCVRAAHQPRQGCGRAEGPPPPPWVGIARLLRRGKGVTLRYALAEREHSDREPQVGRSGLRPSLPAPRCHSQSKVFERPRISRIKNLPLLASPFSQSGLDTRGLLRRIPRIPRRGRATTFPWRPSHPWPAQSAHEQGPHQRPALRRGFPRR
jgi:hypothetical protein